MNWELIVQLAGYVISGIVALLVAGRQHKTSMAEVQAKHNEQMALIEYRLKELEEKVDKHNSVIDRTYKLEERTEIQEERIKVANHRIEDLEDKIEKTDRS